MQRYQVVKNIADTDRCIIFEVVNKELGDNRQAFIVKKYKAKFFDWKTVMQVAEIQNLRKIVHNSVVRLLEVIRDNDNNLNLVFEKYTDSLDHLTPKTGFRLPEPELRSIVIQLLEGVLHIHSLGYVHRSISPHHILVDTSKHRYSICDLSSCVKHTSASGDKIPFGASGYQIGTKGYRAPELMLRMNHSFEVDIFSVGLIAFELLTGKQLLNGSSDLENFCQLINVMGYEELHDWPEGCQALSQMSTEPNIKACQKQLIDRLPEDASQEILEFLDEALRVDPSVRPTALELLNHRWLNPGIEKSIIEQSRSLEKSYSDEIKIEGEEYKDADKVIGG